ncbi:MAG: type II secretion system protein GspG [Spirochaetes bacterium]|nr:type II secretion system protein GspG [Spirochaetota bacterium]
MKKYIKRIRRLARIAASNDGFTLIELMIVVTIIAILSGVSITIYRNYVQRTKVTAAINQIRQFELPLQTTDRIPTTEEGLSKLVEEGLIKRSGLKDPWGNPYGYKSPGDSGEPYMIWSLGADGKEGGEGYDKDLFSTEIE